MIIEGEDNDGRQVENQNTGDDAPIERRGKFDDKRAGIAAKFQAMREAEFGGAEDVGDDFIPETRAPRQETRTDDRNDDVQPGQPQRRKLKVNGREVELTEEQVTQYAQKALASDDILEQAKAVRAEAYQKLDVLNRLEATPAPKREEYQPPARTVQEDTTPDDDELDDIIDSIQVGETKEAKAALQKYGNQIERRIMSQLGNLDDRIRDTTEAQSEEKARKQRATKTLNDFSTDYPEFKTPALQTALLVETVNNMRSVLINQGVEPETIDRIRKEQNLGDNEAVSFAYRALQERGFELPEHSQILVTSANSLREQFGMKARVPRNEPPVTPQERTERKRAMASQPRRANSSPSTSNTEPDINDTRRDAVRQMRMFRRGR